MSFPAPSAILFFPILSLGTLWGVFVLADGGRHSKSRSINIVITRLPSNVVLSIHSTAETWMEEYSVKERKSLRLHSSLEVPGAIWRGGRWRGSVEEHKNVDNHLNTDWFSIYTPLCHRVLEEAPSYATPPTTSSASPECHYYSVSLQTSVKICK